MRHAIDATGAHVVLLEEVLAQARGHEHPAGLRVCTEVSLAALTPRGRHVRVELHCAHTKGQTRKGTGKGTWRKRNLGGMPAACRFFYYQVVETCTRTEACSKHLGITLQQIIEELASGWACSCIQILKLGVHTKLELVTGEVKRRAPPKRLRRERKISDPGGRSPAGDRATSSFFETITATSLVHHPAWGD